MSGIEYLCCVAIGLKSSIKPWNIFKGKINPKMLAKQVKIPLDKYVLTNPNIRKMLTDKRIYLIKNKETMIEIPDEHRVERWKTFLPPLSKIARESVGNVGDTFKSQIESLIKSGKPHTNMIDVLQYKTYRLSLNIQSSINTIVAKSPVLMTNSYNSPFIENACCNESGEYNTKKYFTDNDDKIESENKLITTYSDLRDKIYKLAKAPILHDNRNTKVKLTNEFDTTENEDLIYMAFISHCKYNSGDNIPDDLKLFCNKRPPNYKVNSSIFDKIKTLKANGINYDKGSFTQLLNVINNRNTFKINDLNKSKYDEKGVFSNLIEMLIDDHNIHDERQVLLQHINNEINKTSRTKKGVVGNELSTYLLRINSLSKDKIIKTVEAASRPIEVDFVKKYLDTLMDLVSDTEINITLVKLQDILRKIVNVYPSILLKGLETKVTMDSLPRHWKLSDRHYMDIMKILESQNKDLKNCYKDKFIQKLVVNVSKKNDIFNMLLNEIPLEDNELDIDNQNLINLYLHLILEAITLYIDTSNLPPELEAVKAPSVSIGDTVSRIEDFSPPSLEDLEEVDVNILSQEDQITLKSKLILNIIKLIEAETRSLTRTYADVMKKVGQSKIEEKDSITEYLKNMTDEEREIENNFKNNKLEQWSVGLQKGLFAYDKDTYDREMTSYDNKIRNAEGDLDMIEAIDRDTRAQEIEDREFTTEFMHNDDEYADGMDGDEQY